ncbi:MAG: succinylglutamate desuccinylase/aspartoacylase family protein [Bdellovibrionales bacterium]|nr:succinylglutamate desuccinylase/aspartoacylase family protein [Bdellovibrionales bacterium]
MKSFVFGHTVNQLPIMAYEFGTKGPKVLILGGVHGDEIEGVQAASALLHRFATNFSYRLQLTICPQFNYEGVLAAKRKNPNNVDLNRNLPTNDWTSDVAQEKYDPGKEANSEPENQALVQWLEAHHPSLIISLHSWKPMLNTNGNCQMEAEVISKLTGYEVHDSIGYPTPGCLGTYCGLERDMPTITYELERGMPIKPIIKKHVPAILEALKVTEERR